MDETLGAKKCLKMGLLPSVTTVLNVHREEYLERWLMGQAIQEYSTNGNDAKGAVAHIYNRESENAQFGTDCHGVMEAAMKGEKMPEVTNEVMLHTGPLLAWIKKNVKETLFCEKTMASPRVGAAGTVDMVFIHNNGRRIIGDLKVTKFSFKFPPKPGLAYKMQLSAYEGMIQEVRPDEYTRMSFYLASPFGWDKKPDMRIFEHSVDYLPAFQSARALWDANIMQEMPKSLIGDVIPNTWDPSTYKKP
jgi:hypothetical protein